MHALVLREHFQITLRGQVGLGYPVLVNLCLIAGGCSTKEPRYAPLKLHSIPIRVFANNKVALGFS